MGSTVMLTTFEGTDPSGKLPMIGIARALSSIGSVDVERFSEQALRATKGFDAAKIRVSDTIEFAGKSGYFIEAVQNGLLIKQYITIQKEGR